MRGVVASFEPDGWGLVRSPDGAEHPFHSTAIADGSRQIEAGASVEFTVVPGRSGRWEATALTPAR